MAATRAATKLARGRRSGLGGFWSLRALGSAARPPHFASAAWPRADGRHETGPFARHHRPSGHSGAPPTHARPGCQTCPAPTAPAGSSEARQTRVWSPAPAAPAYPRARASAAAPAVHATDAANDPWPAWAGPCGYQAHPRAAALVHRYGADHDASAIAVPAPHGAWPATRTAAPAAEAEQPGVPHRRCEPGNPDHGVAQTAVAAAASPAAGAARHKPRRARAKFWSPGGATSLRAARRAHRPRSGSPGAAARHCAAAKPSGSTPVENRFPPVKQACALALCIFAAV